MREDAVVELDQARAAELERARASAFVRLADGELDRAYRLARIILGDAGDAEDAVHDAALKAWEHFGELRERERFDAWFGRILVNSCRAYLRRRRVRRTAVDGSPGRSNPDPAEAVVGLDALERAILALGPDHRTIVGLRFWSDLSVEQIAQRTGERAGTVKSRLHYALRELRAAYEAGERTERPDR